MPTSKKLEIDEVDEVLVSHGLKRVGVNIDEVGEMLDESYLTRDMDWAAVKAFAKFVRVYSARKNAKIFEEGDLHAYLCLVSKGKVNIVKKDCNREEKVIAQVNPGRTFGEMSVIDGEPRSATAMAAKDSLILILTRDDFTTLLDKAPRLAVVIVMNVAKLVSQKLRKASGLLVDHLHH